MGEPTINVTLRHFMAADAESAIALWRRTQWTSVSAIDSPSAIARFIDGNPGHSWVAEEGGHIIGTVMCGHDYRRGYIYRLVVAETHYGHGIGSQLLDKALQSLRDVDILKCHAMVINDNPSAEYFWSKRGWQQQTVNVYSLLL